MKPTSQARLPHSDKHIPQLKGASRLHSDQTFQLYRGTGAASRQELLPHLQCAISNLLPSFYCVRELSCCRQLHQGLQPPNVHAQHSATLAKCSSTSSSSSTMCTFPIYISEPVFPTFPSEV